jgi:PAS domain S-box-containing protein
MTNDSQESSQRPPETGAWYNSLKFRMYLRFGVMILVMMMASGIVVAIASGNALDESQARDFIPLVAGPLLLISVVPPLIVLLLLRRDLISPLRYLSRYLNQMGDQPGDFLHGLSGNAPNELVELALAFNERTEALQRSNDQLRTEIEERERAEQALRRSEARFRNVLENTRDMLFEIDLAGEDYTYISPASEEIAGFSPDELRSMGNDEIKARIHPGDVDRVSEMSRRLMESGSGHPASTELEYRWKAKNGDYVWVSVSRTLVRDKDGNPQSVVGSTRNVTERRQREEELRRVRQYLRNIIDSMPSVLVGVDRDGNVTHWNREAERVSGRGAADAAGKPFAEAFPVLREEAQTVMDALDKGTPVTGRRLSAGENEERRHYEIMVYPLRGETVEGAVIRVDDVSERIQIEEMMVQTEKMMSVGGLAAGMAHEINNPLGGILQACQNIERRTSEELEKNRQVAGELDVDMTVIRAYLDKRGILDFITGIREDGSRAAKIVADMLAFSRRSESRFAPANLAELVDTVLRLAANDYDLKKHYDFRRTHIERDFEDNLPEVRCDQTKIEQVLLNLIKNSAQAMASNPRQEDPTITIRLRGEGPRVRIEVADNGPGMKEEVRKRVFEPFFTTKEVGVGTGLGLSVSYFIITKQHRGTMSVVSTPGQGTRFSIRLPLDPGDG